MGIDPDLLAVAAQASPTVKLENESDPQEIKAAWLSGSSVEEKNSLLLKLKNEPDEASVQVELNTRFASTLPKQELHVTPGQRTAKPLLAEAEARRKKREK